MAPVIKVFRVEGRVKAKGESTHIGVFNLLIRGCLAVVHGRAGGLKVQRQSPSGET